VRCGEAPLGFIEVTEQVVQSADVVPGRREDRARIALANLVAPTDRAMVCTFWRRLTAGSIASAITDARRVLVAALCVHAQVSQGSLHAQAIPCSSPIHPRSRTRTGILRW
jgi:hypothetical protein